MSTRKSLDYVIIRAIGDEPVKLRLVAVRGEAVDVVGFDESLPIPFHTARAYYFEEKAFDDLLTAYKNRETERLGSLWAKTKQLKCNANRR